MQRQKKSNTSSRQRSTSRNNNNKSNIQNESMKTKEISITKNEDELMDCVTNLQFKILKKNEQLTKLKEEIIEIQVQWQEDKRNWQNEKAQIDRQTDYYKENIHAERLNAQKLQIQVDKLTQLLSENSKIKQHLDTNNVLEKMSSQLNLEIESLQKELSLSRSNIHILENKLLSKEDTIQNQQLRIQKLKKKADITLQQSLEDKMAESEKQKKRTQEIKDRVQELEMKLRNLTMESERIKKDNRYLQQENDQLRLQYEKYNRLIPTLEDQNKHLENEIIDQEQQIDKLTKQIREISTSNTGDKSQLHSLQEDSKNKSQIIQNLEEQLSEQIRIVTQEQRVNGHLREEIETQKELLDKFSRQSQLMTDAQHKDFDVLEAKIEKISKEMVKMREENSILKQSLQQSKKDCGEYLNTIDIQQKQIRELKQKTKILNEQLDELDCRLNELVQTKQNKIKRGQRVKVLESEIKKQLGKLDSLSSSFSD